MFDEKDKETILPESLLEPLILENMVEHCELKPRERTIEDAEKEQE